MHHFNLSRSSNYPYHSAGDAHSLKLFIHFFSPLFSHFSFNGDYWILHYKKTSNKKAYLCYKHINTFIYPNEVHLIKTISYSIVTVCLLYKIMRCVKSCSGSQNEDEPNVFCFYPISKYFCTQCIRTSIDIDIKSCTRLFSQRSSDLLLFRLVGRNNSVQKCSALHVCVCIGEYFWIFIAVVQFCFGQVCVCVGVLVCVWFQRKKSI